MPKTLQEIARNILKIALYKSVEKYLADTSVLMTEDRSGPNRTEREEGEGRLHGHESSVPLFTV